MTKRRKKRVTIDAQMQKLAKSIYESGMADAMKAAALVMAARKLDEVRALLVASGLNNSIAGVTPPTLAAQPPSVVAPSPPPIRHPCVQCGREGVYRTKPNQWNQTGSWYCRSHMALGTSAELDDAVDRRMNFNGPPAQPPVVQPVQPQQQPSPGASTLAEAMGMAEIVDGDTA